MTAALLTHLQILSPELARAARNYFGLSQAAAAKESGLPDHKIKRFESGNYIPDEPFLRAYRTFFEGKGYTFPDTPEPGANAKGTGQVFPAGVVGAATGAVADAQAGRPLQSSVHHMRIAMDDEKAMGHTLDLIESNEDRIAQLMQQPIEPGFLGGLSDASEARHAEVLSLMAENGALFARLFGRLLGGAPGEDLLDGKAKLNSHADLVHRRHADLHRAVQGDRAAMSRHKSRQPARTLQAALFG